MCGHSTPAVCEEEPAKPTLEEKEPSLSGTQPRDRTHRSKGSEQTEVQTDSLWRRAACPAEDSGRGGVWGRAQITTVASVQGVEAGRNR